MILPKIILGVGVVGLLVIGHIGVAYAASANISHSYKSNSTIPSGSLVSLVGGNPDSVEAANTTNGPKLVGVAVDDKDSLLAVDATNSTTQVANSGTVSALVSTSNGDIAVGDRIAVSPFNGIGMKSEPGNRIIGLAQSAFNSDSKGSVVREVTDKSGKKQSVTVGYIRISIAIGTAPNQAKVGGLQKLAQDIAGHPVSLARVILSTAIAVIAMAALVTLIYGAIFGSIIAVGRNPLAKLAIFRTLSSVIFMAFAIAALAVFTIYLFLR